MPCSFSIENELVSREPAMRYSYPPRPATEPPCARERVLVTCLTTPTPPASGASANVPPVGTPVSGSVRRTRQPRPRSRTAAQARAPDGAPDPASNGEGAAEHGVMLRGQLWW